VIIQLESAIDKNVDTARRDLEALAQTWGHELTEAPDDGLGATKSVRPGDKVVDPIAVSALVLSLPSVAVAAFDLADRIRKRRRAEELIERARRLEARHVAVRLLARRRPVELSSLTPDELLDLLADEDSTD